MWLCIATAIPVRLVTGSERWGVVTLVVSALLAIGSEGRRRQARRRSETVQPP